MDNVCKPKKKIEYISLVFFSALFPFSHKKVYFNFGFDILVGL